MPSVWTTFEAQEFSARLALRRENFLSFFREESRLYVAGSPERQVPSIAIIGTRRPSAYGVRVVRELIAELQYYDFVILSGGALGIDTEAHAAALRHGMKTQAWLVGPKARPNPRSNWPLFSEMQKRAGSGLIVPVDLDRGEDRPPLARDWIFRNHWLVAAADAIVIVEANVKSGTWSSVRIASQMGIPTYLIPGTIFSEQSQGLNAMISRGCGVPVSSIGNLIKSLVVDLGGNPYNYLKAREARNACLEGAQASRRERKQGDTVKLLEYLRKRLDQSQDSVDVQEAWRWSIEGSFTGTQVVQGLMALVTMGELARAGNRFERRGSL